jgi:hypothetical protein
MLTRLLHFFFGCGHHNRSFPITIRFDGRSQRPKRVGTYVVCLDCGSELPYDWARMRISRTPTRMWWSGLRHGAARQSDPA